MCASSRTAANSQRGSVSFLGSIPPAASSGSDTSQAAAIHTCERCSSWVPAACCSERAVNPIRCRGGHSLCACAAVTTEPASPSLPRTRASSGPCSISTRAPERSRLRFHNSSVTATNVQHRSDRRSQTLLNCSSGKRRLTIEERACGLHPGPSSDAQQRPIRDLQSVLLLHCVEALKT